MQVRTEFDGTAQNQEGPNMAIGRWRGAFKETMRKKRERERERTERESAAEGRVHCAPVPVPAVRTQTQSGRLIKGESRKTKHARKI